MCPRSADGERRRETPLERLDRNLEEMTGELRVVVTGVQVLFAFLLIVPFNSGFAHVGAFERAVYFVTLVLAALAAVCTIAPSAGHRFLFRHDDKRYLVVPLEPRGDRRARVSRPGDVRLHAVGGDKALRRDGRDVHRRRRAGCVPGLWFVVPLARLRALEKAKDRDESRPPEEVRRGVSRSPH